jgi:hypothetical protein
MRTTAAPSPQPAAQALARRMVAAAVLPARALRSNAGLPMLLRGPFETPGRSNLVFAHQVWSVPEVPFAVALFTKNHPPPGFDGPGGIGSSGSRTEHTMEIVDYLATPEPNVSAAMLEIRVEGRDAGSIVNVVAVVQWTLPRPSDEQIPADDRVVIVRVVPALHPEERVLQQVVVSDAGRVGLVVHAFDHMGVEPTGVVNHGCTALSDEAVAYRILFATSPKASADVTATIAPCSPVEVTVKGQPTAALSDNQHGAFATAVATVLHRSELTFQ